MDYEKYFEADEKQYKYILAQYRQLNEENIVLAYKLAQYALGFSDRWSEICHQVSKMELECGKDAAFKKRCYEKYRTLQEMHTHCRMIWNKGAEKNGFTETV